MNIKIKGSMSRNLYFETKGLFEHYAKLVANQCWDFSNLFFFCKVNDEKNLQNFKKAPSNLLFIRNGILVLFQEKLNLTNFVIHNVVVFCSLNIISVLQFYNLQYNNVKIVYVCTPTGFFFFFDSVM